MTALAHLVTAFFRQHLAVEKGVSKNTIASYSYAFKFLCTYVSGRLGKSPCELFLEDLDAPMVRDFLEHRERDGRNTARTRNLRLTAIRSFMKYVEYEVPSALEQVRRIRAISSKRTEERLVNHLTKEEMRAILDAPDPRTRSGLRDQAMLYLGFAAGLRVSELVGLRLDDIELDGPYPSLLVRGKGRQRRRLPLWEEATRALRAWMAVRGDARVPEVFVNVRGEALTCSGFTYIVKKYVHVAMPRSPGLSEKRVSPHVLRHYAESRIMPHECCGGPGSRRIPCARPCTRTASMRHNQRLLRKAISRSSGRYRVRSIGSGAVLASAFSFNARSASRYIWVVSTDS
jgi:site-specific recombinase XerD